MPRDRRPTEVAELLTELRERAGLSVSAAAADADKLLGERGRPRDGARPAGVAQSTLTRYEHGGQTPGQHTMRALLDTYGASSDERERLLNLTREARPQHRRIVLHRADAPRYQAEYRDLEQQAIRIRSFTATVVPGLLQTDDYAAAVVGNALTTNARERWLEQRRARRTLVDDPQRKLQFVITVGALSWNLGGHALMADQIARLTAVADLAHIELGVITSDAVADEIVTNNIDLYERADGRHTVIIGTTAGTSILTDAREIAHHAALLDRLAGLAVWGDQARAELDRVRGMYAG